MKYHSNDGNVYNTPLVAVMSDVTHITMKIVSKGYNALDNVKLSALAGGSVFSIAYKILRRIKK